jgi:hypothetical protein
MVTKVDPRTGQNILGDRSEQSAVMAFYRALAPFGVSWTDAVSLWIGLKSKRNLILQASRDISLDELAREIGRVVLGSYSDRLITLQGHPWWAVNTPNQPQLVMMQQRLTSQRLREFLIQAEADRANESLHFMLLRKIGRAEIGTFFVDLPRQLRAFGGIVQLPWDRSSRPIALRENVVIVATEGQDLGLVSEREALDWSLAFTLEGSREFPKAKTLVGDVRLEPVLSSVRCLNPYKAKLRIPTGLPAVDLRIVGEVLTLLHRNDMTWDQGLVTDAYLFMGNAWDRNQKGLFSSQAEVNVHLASGFWLRHAAIPRIWNATKGRSALRRDLKRMISRRYAESKSPWAGLLDSLS